MDGMGGAELAAGPMEPFVSSVVEAMIRVSKYRPGRSPAIRGVPDNAAADHRRLVCLCHGGWSTTKKVLFDRRTRRPRQPQPRGPATGGQAAGSTLGIAS